jgi:hypothetical protein
MVKPDKVIEVGVRDEDVRDPEQTSRREGANVPEIKQEGPPLPGERHIQGRVPEQVVDEGGAKAARHLSTPEGPYSH